ncbi:MAG: VOC family protein [Bacteroidia bacterium]
MIFQALTLHSSQLELQCQFYEEVLGLEVSQLSAESYRFRIGNTFVRLQADPAAKPYHFAINIPCNLIQEALLWLKARVEILTLAANEIQDFTNWNAQAIYFYDADQNIVELIARKNLENASDQDFGPASLLEVSEVGIPTLNIEEVYQQLNQTIGLEIYDGSFERFCAIGDEQGLFICIDPSKKDWFPINDTAWVADFEALVFNGTKSFSVVYKAGELHFFP